MKSRRRFLQNGSLATVALLATNPLKAIASGIPAVSGLTPDAKKVNFLHASKPDSIQQAALLKKRATALVLNSAENNEILNNDGIDASISDIDSRDYKIKFRGDVKVGIIKAEAGQSYTSIDALAANLKNNHHCDLVVCMSSLGFKDEHNPSDLSLAEHSAHLDIIISGHQTNFCKRPYIALNKNKTEVIINHPASNVNDIGKIGVGFDKRTGKKNFVEFIRQ